MSSLINTLHTITFILPEEFKCWKKIVVSVIRYIYHFILYCTAACHWNAKAVNASIMLMSGKWCSTLPRQSIEGVVVWKLFERCQQWNTKVGSYPTIYERINDIFNDTHTHTYTRKPNYLIPNWVMTLSLR